MKIIMKIKVIIIIIIMWNNTMKMCNVILIINIMCNNNENSNV